MLLFFKKEALSFFFVVLLTLILSTAICLSAGRFSAAVVAFAAIANLTSLAAGRALFPLPLAGFATIAQFLLGAVLVSLAIFVLCLTFTLSAGPAALITAALFLVLAAWRRPARAAPPPTTWTELAVTLIACVAAFIWSWQAITAVPRLLATLHFNAWTDYFIHAGEITQFADFHALRGTSYFAAGAPLPPYHYGSYMLPAALTGLTNTLSLTAATALWTPFGFLLMGLAAALLGGVLAGEPAGILAVIAILLIPSAAHYGMSNPFFDLHWLLQISTTACYALAAAALALVSLIFWLRDPRLPYLAWAVGLTLATGFFRVHIFVALAALNFCIFLAAWRPNPAWRRPALAAATATLALAALLFLEHLQRAPHFFTGDHQPSAQIQAMLSMPPSPFQNLFAAIAAALQTGPGPLRILAHLAVLAAGLILLCAAAFGLWLPIYIILFLYRRHTNIAQPTDYFPLAALAAYLAIVTFFPADPTEHLEFAHRPYVLVYFLLAVWTAAFTADLLRLQKTLPPLAAAILLLATPAVLQANVQKSGLAWYTLFYGLPVPRPLIDTAAYIRTHAAQHAVIANPPDPLDEVFLALTQRPEYAPGTIFLTIQSGLPPDTATARAATLAKILASPATAAAQHIGWLVTFPPENPTPRNPAFTQSGYVVQQIFPKP